MTGIGTPSIQSRIPRPMIDPLIVSVTTLTTVRQRRYRLCRRSARANVGRSLRLDRVATPLARLRLRGRGIPYRRTEERFHDLHIASRDAAQRRRGASQARADELARRIVQLEGDPNFAPRGLAERSHAEYVAGHSLDSMIRENLVAERID